MLSYARDDGKLRQAAQEFGATAGPPSEAAAFGDVVVLCVPWNAVSAALNAAGPLTGKVLWDCTNALRPDMSGLAVGTTSSAAETIARLVPEARVVKGIPPFAEVLHSADPTMAGKPGTTFICGDDEAAKGLVKPLLEALPAKVVDAGPLLNARYVEPAAFLLVSLAYDLGVGSRIGLDLLRG
jgi:predicted dinucleotide-binding enzyme